MKGIEKLQFLVKVSYKIKGIDLDSLYTARQSFGNDPITGKPITKQNK